MEGLPKTRTGAKAIGSKYYFTGGPCKRGHVDKRYSTDGSCVACAFIRHGERYAANRDEILGYQKGYYRGNGVKIRNRVNAYRIENLETIKARKKVEYEKHKLSYITRAREWKKLNPGKAKQFIKNWAIANPDKAYQPVIRRRMRLSKRTPPWLTDAQKQEIRDIYAKARALSISTGVPHQVDHIMPIRGKLSSGLHVPWNLQILTAKENRAKSNLV